MKHRVARLALAASLLLIASIFVLVSCSGKESAAGPIKIGVSGPYTGDLASYGIPSRKAAEIVIEAKNKEGGLLKRNVELVIEDDQCKAEVASNVAAKLVGEEVVAVLGHICSGATTAAAGIYESSGIVLVSPSATTPDLTLSGDYPNFFRTISRDDAQAKLIADFALDKLGATKIAILHDKDAYGKGLAEFVQQYVDEDPRAEVVLFEGITAGAVDYSSIINKVKAAGAQAVVYGGYHPEASKLVTQGKKAGWNVPFISDDGVKDDTFIKVAGEYAEGVYASGPIDTTQSPEAQAAIKAHQDKYGEDPGAFFLNAYAAIEALLNAIEKAESTEYEKIMGALRSNYVNTPLGSISFDENGDAIGIGFAMFQVKNGAYAEVK
ncbi:MAG: branched-chain amino acid ABC transporter substrate-binding protein [Spirochaetales bacterium]|nr:branched-chain amino acid ABC transporter substrate-binding protein [Spirochaetales bacterium]